MITNRLILIICSYIIIKSREQFALNNKTQTIIMIKIMILCILFILKTTICQYVDGILSIGITDSRVNEITDYVFTVTLVYNQPLLVDSVVEIYLPAEYESSPAQVYTCSIQKWPFLVSSLSCTITHRVLKVEGGFPQQFQVLEDTDFEFKVEGIKNPSVAATQTEDFSGKILRPDSSVIIPISTATAQITPGILGVSMSVNPNTVYTLCDLYLTITPSNPIPLGGWIKFESASSTWTRASSFNVQKIFTADLSSQCESVSNNLPSNLNCDEGQTATSLKIFNIVGSQPLEQAFTIKITSVMSPPTTESQGQFTITTLTSSGGAIDRSTNNKVSGTIPRVIRNPSITLSSYQNDVITTATIGLTIGSFISTSDIVYIKIPKQISLTPLTKINTQGKQIIIFSITNDTTHYYLSFSGIFISEFIQFQLVLQSIRNPSYVITTSNFSIWTKRYNFLIDEVLDAFNYTTVAGDANMTVTPNLYQAGKLASYTFDIEVTRSIGSTNIIEVIFPSQGFSIASGSIFECTSDLSPNCVVNTPSQNTLRFTNFIATGTHTQLSIGVKFLKNPSIVGDFPSLIVSTYTDTNYLIDQETDGIFFQTEAREIDLNRIQVDSNSEIVYARAELTLSISPHNDVPDASKLIITIPPQLLISSLTCSLTCTLISDTTYSIVLGQYLADSIIVVVLKNIRNPTSTAPTSSFQIRITTSSGILLQYRDNSIAYAASIPSGLSINLNRNSTQNSAKNVTYQLTLGLIFAYTYPVAVLITLSKEVGCVGCLIEDSNATHYSILKDQLTFAVDKSLYFTLPNMINFYSKEAHEMKIAVYSQNAIFQIAENTYTITNEQEGTIAFTDNFSVRELVTETSLSITDIAATYSLFKTLTISFGEHFDLTNAALSSATDSYSLMADDSSKIITITKLVSQVPDFSISGLVSPGFTPSYGIRIITYSSTGASIDKSGFFYWSTLCDLPCRQCEVSNISICLSCYSDQDLVQGQVLYLQSNNSCTSLCPLTYYTPNEVDCFSCSASCLNCIATDITCTSCPLSLPYLFNSTCYSQCPVGYFEYSSTNPKICLQCDADNKHCETCNNFQGCVSCLSNYYLFGDLCLSDCPNETHTENPYTWQCDPCSANCEKCNDQGCYECLPGFLLDQGFCYGECQTFGYVAHNGICRTCDPICLTCIDNIYNCLSCNTSSENPFYLNNTCLESCPDGYYHDYTFYYCVQCNEPCEYCTTSSVSSCTSCIDSFSLYQTTCKNNCPDQYYEDGSQCYPCTNNCKTCTTSTICMSCITGYNLFDGECIQGCGDGYVSLYQKCVECSSNCRTCELVNYCDSCFMGTFLFDGACLSPCPDKYYQLTLNQSYTCEECPYSCQKCSNAENCTSCITGYQLYNFTCVSTCDDGLVPLDAICQPCSSECLTCVYVPLNCSSCMGTNYSYWNSTSSIGRCFEICPLSLHLYQKQKSCVTTCPVSTFVNEANACQECQDLCLQCTSDIFCTFCQNGISILNGVCYQTCPLEAKYPVNGVCRTCDIVQCYECDQQLCRQCNSGFFIVSAGKQCIDSCGTLQEYDTQKMQCVTVVETKNQTDTSQTNTTNPTTPTNSTDDNNNTNTIITPSPTIDLDFVPLPYLLVAIVVMGAAILLHFTHQISIFRFIYSIVWFFLLASSVTELLIILISSQFMIPNVRLLSQNNSSSLGLGTILLISGLGWSMLLNIQNVIMYMYKVRIKRYIIVVLLSTFLGMKLVGGLLCSGLCGVNMRRNLKESKYMSGFSNSQVQDQYKKYWKVYDFLQMLNIISDALFIGSGILLAFYYSLSDYQLYGAIQIIILSVVDLILTIFWYIGRNKFAAPETASIMGSNSNQSVQHLQEQQHQKQFHDEQNSLNEELTQKYPHTENYGIKDDDKSLQQLLKSRAYRSELDRPLDVIKLKKQQIEEAINQGVYRRNKNSLAQKQRKDDQQSALDSANKFNNKMQADIIFEDEEQSKIREQNDPHESKKRAEKQMDFDDEEEKGLDRGMNDEKETEEDQEKSEAEKVEEKIIFEDFDESLESYKEDDRTIRDESELNQQNSEFVRQDSLGSLQNPKMTTIPFKAETPPRIINKMNEKIKEESEEQDEGHSEIKKVKVQAQPLTKFNTPIKNTPLKVEDLSDENKSDQGKENNENKFKNIFEYEMVSEERYKQRSHETSPQLRVSQRKNDIIYADLESVGTAQQPNSDGQPTEQTISYKKPFFSIDAFKEEYIKEQRPGEHINTNFRYNKNKKDDRKQPSFSSMPKKIPIKSKQRHLK